MPFPVSDAGGMREPISTGSPTPPDLRLVVERLGAALALDETGLAILDDSADWHAVAHARAVVAFVPDTDRPLEALARLEAAAKAAGRRIAHAGLLVTTSPPGGRRECPLLIACRPQDDELAELVETGPLGVALDPHARPTADQPAARVLIASYEVTGPTGNGGIGTAYHSLAHALAAAGHDVTVLFTGWLDPGVREREPAWRAAFAEAGIRFELLGTPWDSPVRSPHHAVRRSYELHRWLADAHAREPFDVVHVPECQGHGAFAQTAKALGLAYEDVEFVVGTHSSTRWIGEANREGMESLDQLVVERLERISVARADVLLSPSAYLVDYMRSRGWHLPERTFVQQYARPQSVRSLAATSGTEPAADAPPDELVFFGRLETRKGLEAFCDAVDLLVAEDDCPFERITLLGRPERVLGEDAERFVARRAGTWDRPWAILPDLGHAEAVAYLRSHRCVVAIPSLVDNSPNTVSEAIALGVPFVASRSGGTAELIAPGDLARATFDGWGAGGALEPPTFADDEAPFDARALAAALRAKAAEPGARVAPAVDAAACDRVYDAWHRALASGPSAPKRDGATPSPAVAVLLVEAQREDIVRIAAALERGTRPPHGIAALCVGGGDPVPGVVTVEADARDQGRARADAIAQLDADVVVVLRGADEPDAALLERVGTAMAVGDADLLALVVRDPVALRADDVPPELRRTDVPADLRAFVPTMGPAAATIAYPALSVGPYAIQSAALARLGGWATDLWGEALDHELLSRAALAGVRIEVLPDPLATSLRDDRWADMRGRYWGDAPFPAAYGEEQIRLLRPFRRLLPAELADLPALLVGALRAGGTAYEERAAHAAERREIVDVYEARVVEQRALIELYEERQAEMRAALAQRSRAGTLRRLRRGLRRPVREWPGRGGRFARHQLRHRLRRRPR